VSGLKDHSFRFTRPTLGMRDAIVLKSMEMALSEVYEPMFSDASHRNKESCLEEIKSS